MDQLGLAALTAFFGVFVFVAGQVVIRLFIEPILKQRRIIGEIVYNYTFLGNVSALAKPEEINEATKTLRKLSSELRASRYEIPFYKVLEKPHFVLSEVKLQKASTNLIGWSNEIGTDIYPKSHRKELGEILNLVG